MATDPVDFDFGDERSRTRRLGWLAGGLSILVLLGGAGWHFFVRDTGTEAVSVERQEVQVTTGQLVSSFATTGTASADLSADLTFSVAGKVESVSVAEGDLVARGQEIARLESEDAAAAVTSAEASLQIAQLQLDDLLKGASTADRASAAQSVTNAQSSVANAEKQLKNAQEALSDAYLGPTDAELTAADNAITQAETSVQNAQNQATSALASLNDAFRQYCNLYDGSSNALPCNYNGIGNDVPLDDEEIDALTQSLVAPVGNQQVQTQVAQKAEPLISANGQYESAALGLTTAKANLEKAEDDLQALYDPPTADEISDLKDAVLAAQRSLDAAQAGLTVAYERQAELNDDPDPLTLAQREESVRSAERQLEQARDNLAATVLVAPFDGTVASLAIEAGDSAGAQAIVATITDTGQISVELTVSESDLPGLVAGQLGMAEFSALPDEQYVVEIVSVAALPDVTQGVVTYPVVARVLRADDLTSLEGGTAQVAQMLTALGTGGGFQAAGGAGAGAFSGGTAGAGGQGQAGGAGSGFEGVRQLMQLLTQDADGTWRLQEGTEVPEGLQLPDGFVIHDDGTVDLPEGFALRGGPGAQPGAAGGANGTGAAGLLSGLLDAPTPSLGMTATVTILKEIQSDVLLVPNSAISIRGGASSVTVLNADGTEEQRPITTGDSDSSNTIVVSGLTEGETVLVVGSVVSVPVQSAQQDNGPIFAPGGFGGPGGQTTGGGN